MRSAPRPINGSLLEWGGRLARSRPVGPMIQVGADRIRRDRASLVMRAGQPGGRTRWHSGAGHRQAGPAAGPTPVARDLLNKLVHSIGGVTVKGQAGESKDAGAAIADTSGS
jgi:hypothetical protein